MFKKIFAVLFIMIISFGVFKAFKKSEIELVSINDQKVYQISKDKVTAILFWAPNCSACVYNLRNIAGLQGVLKDFDAELFFLIDNDDFQKAGGARSVFVRLNLSDDIVTDGGALFKKYNVTMTPTLIILHKDKIIFKKVGFVDWNDAEQLANLTAVLKENV